MEVGISGVPRQREWDLVSIVDIPELDGAPVSELAFRLLDDGRVAGAEPPDVPSSALSRLAALVTESLAPPCEVRAVRRGVLDWSLAARRISVELVELPELEHVEDLVVALAPDGEPNRPRRRPGGRAGRAGRGGGASPGGARSPALLRLRRPGRALDRRVGADCRPALIVTLSSCRPGRSSDATELRSARRPPAHGRGPPPEAARRAGCLHHVARAGLRASFRRGARRQDGRVQAAARERRARSTTSSSRPTRRSARRRGARSGCVPSTCS